MRFTTDTANYRSNSNVTTLKTEPQNQARQNHNDNRNIKKFNNGRSSCSWMMTFVFIIFVMRGDDSSSPFRAVRGFSCSLPTRRTTTSTTTTTFPRKTETSTAATTTTLWRQHPNQVDVDIRLGSSEINEEGDEDEDSEERELRKRQETINNLLAEKDKAFREERKRRKWGKLANVTSRKELEPMIQEAREALEKENQVKASLAAQTGVTMEILEPMDGQFSDSDNDNDKVNIKTKRAGEQSKWYSDVDEELKQEWQELVGNDGDKNNKDPDGDEEENNNNNNNNLDMMNDVQIENGKVVSNGDKFQGVRVGSAGGWELEVFPGDFVVHRKFGIGRFEKTCLRSKTKLTQEEKDAQVARRTELLTAALKRLSTQYRENGSGGGKGFTQEDVQAIREKFGTPADTDPISNPQTTVLEIAYADAVVHVPVDRAYRLSRYRAGDAVVKPKLSKVKGEAWSKAKQKVEENTLQLAQDVLALYSTRETLQRPPYDPVLEPEIATFGKTFKYDPTPDQTKCFEDTENDMVWRTRPMDRLICGDVGFGKTEVAMRALYRAVVNGKQAVLLAPTGVLAAQHYKNVVSRMGPDSPFNVSIALLRGGMGKNTKAGRLVRQQITDGEANLIVGTHALLSNDLKFNDLGLLVVDEEQRFGVKQKERLKLISKGVDVLTLSATPIPRTLQMSLSGIRDTSTIRSPPPMRKPTETYVQDFSEEVVEIAIRTELERGGQCYYVVPRISQLEEAEAIITRLFPDIRVIQAHGRMQRNGAEQNVAEFAEGKHDVLLATTVIENGVDIPTVNTIIIQNSQNFGISTLYQLRGRVGRSDLQAYAYFLHQEQSITEQAAMRLQAIGELQELGSGFDVANRDLEIRGAGSLLGTEQSGMAAKVGFDLYMRMLKKSIRQLRGLDLPLVPRTNIVSDTLLPRVKVGNNKIASNSLDTFTIPENYIPDPKTRQEEETKARLAESTDKLVQLTADWKEKYGNLPPVVQVQLKSMHLHCCTRRLGIDLVGLIDSGMDNEDGSPKMDCVLRSPGFRPRHLALIIPLLSKKGNTPPKGVDIYFPKRFSRNGDEDFVVGGGDKQFDIEELLKDSSLNGDGDDWDAMDQEEIEAMKDISSAWSVKDMDDIDIEQYPRFVIHDFADNNKKPTPTAAVDHLLKVFLPISKAVYGRQESDKDNAKAAAELREKRSLINKRKKDMKALENKRLGNIGHPLDQRYNDSPMRGYADLK